MDRRERGGELDSMGSQEHPGPRDRRDSEVCPELQGDLGRRQAASTGVSSTSCGCLVGLTWT